LAGIAASGGGEFGFNVPPSVLCLRGVLEEVENPAHGTDVGDRRRDILSGSGERETLTLSV